MMNAKTVDSPAKKPAPFPNVEWELRPSGMLVQKRNPFDDAQSPPAPAPIRVRVKYNSSKLEALVSPHASFGNKLKTISTLSLRSSLFFVSQPWSIFELVGELKKLLAAKTGLHPEDQRILYKDKERESTAFLDLAGVKDKSKLVLVEDPVGHERRRLEKRKAARSEMAAKSISDIGKEVDKLAVEV